MQGNTEVIARFGSDLKYEDIRAKAQRTSKQTRNPELTPAAGFW
jgi:hypothetical protein